ncbi:MAG: hypothetical protein SWY16_24820, partial [Cyanobacteriota bacterium]|nr:hypothetical protein [Cyanobacteriota bacterium]
MPTPFIPTGRGNPCPICEDTSSKCRTLRNSDTVLCMTSAGYDAAVAGYRYVGDDKKQHLWGIYVTDDDSKGKDRAAARAERARRAEEQRQKELFELSFSLPIGERSAQNRGLLLQLELDRDHQQNLRDRGLSDVQIQAGLFKSVKPGQKLSRPISPRLAGIDRNAERIFVSGRGLLCPAFDPYGRILGMQLRLDNPSGGKYRWLKSKNSSKLPNGEMPLTTVKPEGKVRRIGLCEGIMKPYVATGLSGDTLFIGAAGGNFHASRRQLEEVLKWARDEYGELPIAFYPDGGGLANRQVFRRDLNTLNLLRRWGKLVRVAYWEQGFSKTVLDIDELLAAGGGDQIRTLTVARYQQLRHDAIWGWQEPLKTIEQLFRRIEVEGGDSEKGRQGDKGDKGDKRDKRDKRDKGTREKITIPHTPFPIPHSPFPIPRSPIQFEPGQRLNTIASAISQGWKHILDNSACGTGKSFDVGVATPSRFGVRKLWALSPTHRNPTTITVEANYTDLTVRNNGFKLDPHRRTERGNPYRLWPGLGETPETVGNCHRTSLFRTLADKNFPNIEAKDNPICATCHLHGACAHSSGNGYGFRHQRRQDLQSSQIRAHPDSCPVPEEYDYSGDGAFWDEVRTTFGATRSVSATAWDLHQTAAYLAVDFPELWHRLQPFIATLDDLLNDPKPPYHGWNDSDLRSILPALEEATASESIEELYNMMTERDLGLEAEDAIDYSQLNWQERKGIGWANRLLKAHTRQRASVAHQAVGNLPTNWAIPFLEVLSRLTSGALRVHRGRLTVTIASDRHPDLTSAMAFNVYQDATMSRWRLALMLGIDESEILVIAQKKAPTPNLSIIQIPDIGLATKGRTQEADRRIEALVKAASERHDNVAVAEWKRKMDEIPDRCETRLTLLGDTRGSNAAKACDALVICGTTFRNIGALEDEYRTLTGRGYLIPGTAKACTRRQTIGEIPPGLLDYVERTVSADAGLQAYIDDDVSSEMKQATERLRAHLRPEETLTAYVVSSHPLPFQVTLQRAFDICPEAGNKQQRKWHLIREAIAQLREMGDRITQKAIEGITDIPQNSIGRLCGAIEGFSWKRWLKISTSLIETSFNKMDIFREIDDEGVIPSRENCDRVDRERELPGSFPIPHSPFPSPNRSLERIQKNPKNGTCSITDADLTLVRASLSNREFSRSSQLVPMVTAPNERSSGQLDNHPSGSTTSSDAEVSETVGGEIPATVRSPSDETFSRAVGGDASVAPALVLDEEARSIARDYLPILADCETDEAISTLILLWQGFEERWDSVVGWMSSQVREILLAHLLSLLPPQALEK